MLVGLIEIEDYLHTKSYHNLGKRMTKISQLLLYNCSDTDSYSCRGLLAYKIIPQFGETYDKNQSIASLQLFRY
jgi:hypothetical protein